VDDYGDDYGLPAARGTRRRQVDGWDAFHHIRRSAERSRMGEVESKSVVVAVVNSEHEWQDK
jgi:hypothetical protein